jgi:Sigma-70, region 4
MTLLDDLPPDQRAVLLLLVQQGKSHAEIAELLGIPERSVRERAQAGLDALAEGPSEAPARAGAAEAPRWVGPDPGASSSAPRAPAPRSTPRGARTPSSRTGASRRAGALLLIALVAAIVVAVILLTGGGGSSKSASSGTSGTSTAAQPHIDKQLKLTSPEPGSNAIGIAEVLSQGKQYAFFVAAEHMPPTSGFFYAAWLYNSPGDAQVLGRAPSVGSNGRLQAVGALPSNAAHYHQLLITRETATKPTHPGPIVLSGPFSLH